MTPASRLLLKARQSDNGKSLTPFADNLTRRIQPGRDHVIGDAFIRSTEGGGGGFAQVGGQGVIAAGEAGVQFIADGIGVGIGGGGIGIPG